MIIKELEGNSTSNEGQELLSDNRINEKQIAEIHKVLKDMKSSEDILARAKSILKKHSDQSALVKIHDPIDLIFLRILFSFHPTRSNFN